MQRGIVVAGFSDGLFGVYSLDTMECVHTLSIGDSPIKSIAINGTGDWLAFGSAKAGQLLVWEWMSETYVFKQQSHASGIRRIAYSPDGRLLATGGQDGKIKLWDASTGACFVTFGEHQGPVTEVLFNPKGNAIFSASMDGTIRGFDLTRYRNFRTMAAPNPVQFSCLAMDPSGEILCAGTLDDFTVYCFNVQTGALLEVLSGHEAPVSRVLFSPTEPVLASCGWDGTVRLHYLYGRGRGGGSRELLRHGETGRDVTCAAFRQDGLEMVVGLLDGSLHFWDPKEVEEVGIIDGRKDIWAGRGALDVRKAGRQSSHFEAVAYGSGGSSVFATANGSKWVLMYGVSSKTLLKRFCLSQNVYVDGVLEMQNSKLLTDFGPTAEVAPTDDDVAARQEALPGAAATISRDICVSPSGDEWCALSPEGVHVFRRNFDIVLDAPGLSLGDTPESVKKSLQDGDTTRALAVAMGLDMSVVPTVLACIPLHHISLAASALPVAYVPRLLSVLAEEINEDKPYLELYLVWLRWLLGSHSIIMRREYSRFREPLLAVQRALLRKSRSVAETSNANLAMLRFLIAAPIAPEEDFLALEGIDELEGIDMEGERPEVGRKREEAEPQVVAEEAKEEEKEEEEEKPKKKRQKKKKSKK
jgi:periodic tryptophan protein 2